MVTLDEKKWSGRPAYAKWSGTQAGFGSQVQTEDGIRQAYAVAAPVLLLACLVCAGLSAARQGSGWTFLWTASATLTAASAWRRPWCMPSHTAGWPGGCSVSARLWRAGPGYPAAGRGASS